MSFVDLIFCMSSILPPYEYAPCSRSSFSIIRRDFCTVDSGVVSSGVVSAGVVSAGVVSAGVVSAGVVTDVVVTAGVVVFSTTAEVVVSAPSP